MDLEELERRIDNNAIQIEKNLKKIENNLSKIENNSKNIQKNSLAFDILKDYKKSNKRLYGILIAMLVLWVLTLIIFHI